MMEEKYVKGWFNCCENSNVLEGYSILNEDWNGAACPCFTKDVVDQYITSYECTEWYEVFYSERLDTYFFVDLECDNNVIQYKGKNIEIESGELKHVYDIGSCIFLWDREEKLEDHIKYGWAKTVLKESEKYV